MANPVAFDSRLEEILTVAANVFASKGFHPTTMRDLSRETDMSLAGIYHYVSGKNELLYLISQRSFAAVLAGAERAVAEGHGPADRLERFIRHHVNFFASHMSEMKVLSHEADSLDGSRLADINALKRRYVGLLRTLVADVDEGSPRGDPQIAAYALFGMMNWIYTWYHPDGPITPDALADRFAQLFLSGVAAPSPSTAPQGD